MGRIITICFLLMSTHLLSIDKPVFIKKICLNRSDSTAVILWSNQVDNCSSFEKYIIYGREDVASSFNVMQMIVDPLVQTTQIKLSNLKQWSFFMVSEFDCNGQLLISDTVTVDIEQPHEWEVDSVSVDLITQQVIVGWSPHPVIDKDGYIIYYVGATNQLVTDTKGLRILDGDFSDPTKKAETYALATYDSCRNTSPISRGHTTVFLEGTYDTCNRSMRLNWSRYIGHINEMYVIKYTHSLSQNFVILDSVDFSTNTFIVNNLIADTGYIFQVQMKVINNGRLITSSSNIISINTDKTSTADNYIRFVSVMEDKRIHIRYQTELNNGKVQLLRKSTNDWSLINEDIAVKGRIYNIIDSAVITDTRSYTYRITHMDQCNNPIVTDSSFEVSSILLKGDEIIGQRTELTWNNHAYFLGSEYNDIIKTKITPVPPRSTWNFISQLPPTLSAYIDPHTGDELQFNICYAVLAKGYSYDFDDADTAYSNTLCFVRELVVYFPNAFAPMGINTMFKAYGVGISESESVLDIYNRWGEKVFTTSYLYTGWNGQDFNGNDAPQGPYFYTARIVGNKGEIKEYKGVVNLIR
jgi:gliding motility-associated-like protein